MPDSFLKPNFPNDMAGDIFVTVNKFLEKTVINTALVYLNIFPLPYPVCSTPSQLVPTEHINLLQYLTNIYCQF